MPSQSVLEQLKSLPSKPGVYLMRDAAGEIIYVGKALNLRNRVRSYFHAQGASITSPKLHQLASQIAQIDFIVTSSEVEALILECNLIKKHRPRFNVRLKDDKRYPYIKITLQEDYPRLIITRRMLDDGSRYFGPYTSVKAVHQTLDVLRRIFPYLTCKREITGRDKRACLYYHIGRCAGPCIGAISKEDYQALVEQICLFLEGKQERIVAELRDRMRKAADDLQYEAAARLRDQIQAIEKVMERQKVVSSTGEDQDVIALARDDREACVQVLIIRQGKLIGSEYFIMTGTQDEETQEIITAFVKQFYDEAAYVPKEILLQSEVDGAPIIRSWLQSKRGNQVILRVPKRGADKELVQMAAENAAETLAHLKAQWEADQNRHVAALNDLQEHLRLPIPPARIECYDISNIQGALATGSMVVFVKGVARKSDYRRFRIKTVPGANDYAMLQEVLRRRFRRALQMREEIGPAKDAAWAALPDLIIVDGGLGQANAAHDVMTELGLDQVPVVGLAKQNEELFLPAQSKPILLPRGSDALHLVQRIRDEAHRFAIGYHRQLRRKSAVASALEEIPYIGPKRRRALLKRFGSLEAIREASVEELASVEGMSREAAERVKELL